MNNDTERAPATEEKIVELVQYNGRKELSEVPPCDYEEDEHRWRWYFD